MNVHLGKRKGITEKDAGTKESEEKRDTTKTNEQKEFIKHTLSTTVLFQKLDNDQINAIASAMWKQSYAAEHLLVSKGEMGRSLFLIANGTVAKFNQAGEIQTINAGQTIGELGLMYSYSHDCTYKVLFCDLHFCLFVYIQTNFIVFVCLYIDTNRV